MLGLMVRLMELRLRLEQGGLCRRRCSFPQCFAVARSHACWGVRLSKSTLNTHFGCRTLRGCHNTGPLSASCDESSQLALRATSSEKKVTKNRKQLVCMSLLDRELPNTLQPRKQFRTKNWLCDPPVWLPLQPPCRRHQLMCKWGGEGAAGWRGGVGGNRACVG
jgi:hypothetical protein